jgi:hypothetical protein
MMREEHWSQVSASINKLTNSCLSEFTRPLSVIFRTGAAGSADVARRMMGLSF